MRLRITRHEARELVSAGAVRIDGRTARGLDKSSPVAQDWQIAVTVPLPAQAVAVVPEPQLAIPILAEGPDWVVVDKPAGVPVHPLRVDERGTVLNALVAKYPQLPGVGEGGLRSGGVHRLDGETSGTLLFALGNERYQRLREAFRKHQVLKRYRCVVSGQLRGSRHEIMHLVIARRHPATVKVLDPQSEPLPPGARRCDLSWKAIEGFPRSTLIEVTLGTGFLHQIRVMLARLNHPVLGDPLYAGRSSERQSQIAVHLPPRLMLHACELAVDAIRATRPDPPPFTASVEALRRPQ